MDPARQNMDPAVDAMTTISVRLKWIDQFREFTLRVLGIKPTPPSTRIEQSGDVLQLTTNYGGVVTEMTAEQMDLSKWDKMRLDTLEERAYKFWADYNRLYKSLSNLSEYELEERARIEREMNVAKRELCTDFREMVRIYEATLGIGLPDHYTLYEVC
jgi:hypothetical protein